MNKITREEALERWPFEGSAEWQDMQLKKLLKVRALAAMISDPNQWVQNEWTTRIASELRCILDSPDQP